MAPSNGPPPQTGLALPLIYRLFFLVLEPVSALVGAYFCHARQARYLTLLDASSAAAATYATGAVPLGTSVALSQLAAMYLFFALNEAVVLRSTGDLRVWRAVLAVLLLADLAHLYALRALAAPPRGSGVYHDVLAWNAADWGNVPWVYAGAALRVCFLAGVGMGTTAPAKKLQ
ncbi:hypothetical protein V2A60_005497 [Cordyceps javanica]|uniref:NADP-dependent alcohol dehydrogenase-like protein n=1 Tax=Cordyceps javanica TaxID=43265 RepID=A0A545VX65_9HYPO|nr:NADP-dependent alcohol dehydrogenase-like protein [Cordyceps javanica]TQW06321.1 NADP-dependent alcohol dehydrogenase-like protein [Cordyceps javanica]